ncbi:MAG: GNAT family acetyltransferase [Alteromonadaceae bacterium]|nr:MAG: GNAT family acetyltransferase [Alteromonadaceae bacterium]
MKIRQFTQGDRQAVIELWETCELTRPWNNPNTDIDRKIQFQPELFLVGAIGTNVIASAMAGYDGHRGSLYYFAVHPNHQGKGHGQQLMTDIEQRLISLGCPKLNTSIRTTNTAVLEFYTHLDYITDEVLSIGKRLIPDTQ